MRRTLAVALLFAASCYAGDPAYRPLWLYQGSWSATSHAGDSKPEAHTVVNDCAMVGRFFACQQTVDGKAGAMLVFSPAATAGDYYTQAVLPDGHAIGRGELHIEGDRWTYSGKSEEGGKTSYSRTTNLFSGKDRIHFEIATSPDGQTWTTTLAGDEVRTSKGKH